MPRPYRNLQVYKKTYPILFKVSLVNSSPVFFAYFQALKVVTQALYRNSP